ncbi:MAG: hypothetical protein ABI779_24135 [Acidobacteriota bacterium]
MITKSDWQTAHQRMMDEGRRKVGEPPTADQMLAYTRGELSPAEEDRIRELLVHYPELARMAAEPFPSVGAEPGDPDYMSEHEFARHWTSLQGRLDKPRNGRVLQFWRASAACAAALALLFGGLLWKARSELQTPRTGWEQAVLTPDGQRGAGEEGVVLSADSDVYGLVAQVGGEPQFDEYRLEIVDAGGARIWSQALHGRGENENMSIVVSRSFLKPGKHKLVLYGVDGARDEQLATYSFRVPARSGE